MVSKSYRYQKPKRLEKLTREELLSLLFDLISAFKSVKTPIDTVLLMQDLLTASEIKKLARRLRIAKLILNGATQRDISKELACSTATVTKVGVWLNRGGDGLRKTISKLPKRYSFPKKLPKKPLEFQLPQLLLAAAQYSLAKNQQKQIKKLDKFIDNIEDKKQIDKELQKMFDEHYRRKY